MSAKYGVRFVCVAGSCRLPMRLPNGNFSRQPWGSMFVVAAIGDHAGASPGFMNSTEAEEWAGINEGCPVYKNGGYVLHASGTKSCAYWCAGNPQPWSFKCAKFTSCSRCARCA
jgi:hypothetical protein